MAGFAETGNCNCTGGIFVFAALRTDGAFRAMMNTGDDDDDDGFTKRYPLSLEVSGMCIARLLYGQHCVLGLGEAACIAATMILIMMNFPVSRVGCFAVSPYNKRG